jgi:hypothetical protein
VSDNGTVPCTDTTSVLRRGDSNTSGSVDISDALSTLGFLFAEGSAPSCPDAADANDDGLVDISDAVRTLNFLFLGTEMIPPPGPMGCGIDPTPDELSECSYEDGC